MRRRQPAAPAGGELPAELVRFRLADWHDPADAIMDDSGAMQAGTKIGPEEARAMQVQMRARRRWTDARRRWCEERGLRVVDLPPALGPVVDRP